MTETPHRWVRIGTGADVACLAPLPKWRYRAFETLDPSDEPRDTDDYERIYPLLEESPPLTQIVQDEEGAWQVRPDLAELELAIATDEAQRIGSGDERGGHGSRSGQLVAEVNDHGNVTLLVATACWSPVAGQVHPDEVRELPVLDDPSLIVDDVLVPLRFRKHLQLTHTGPDGEIGPRELEHALDRLADRVGIQRPRDRLGCASHDSIAEDEQWDAFEQAIAERDPRLQLEARQGPWQGRNVPRVEWLRLGAPLRDGTCRRPGHPPPDDAEWWEENAFGRQTLVERRPAWRIAWEVV